MDDYDSYDLQGSNIFGGPEFTFEDFRNLERANYETDGSAPSSPAFDWGDQSGGNYEGTTGGPKTGQTGAPYQGGLGSLGGILASLGKGALGAITKPNGDIDYAKLIPLLGGLGGAIGSYNESKKTVDTGYSKMMGTAPGTKATRTMVQGKYGPYADTRFAAQGGLMSLSGDGMSDHIPASIDGKRPAKLSSGEFVLPADVVSHLGNGDSQAGARNLYEMMKRIREARTGSSQQGRQINPTQMLPE